MINYGIYSGSGNTFCVLKDAELSITEKSKISYKCGYCYNVDGVLFADFNALSMQIFDKDGTYERMCGNGLSIISHIANDSGILAERDKIMTDDGIKKTIMLEVELGKVVKSGLVRDVAGVPHIVVSSFLDFNEAMNLRKCYNANITSVDLNTNFCRTFEVGVENFTKSCGTGAAAVLNYLQRDDIELHTSGGIMNIRKESDNYYLNNNVWRVR